MRLIGTEMLRECVLDRVDNATYKLYGEVPFWGLKNLKLDKDLGFDWLDALELFAGVEARFHVGWTPKRDENKMTVAELYAKVCKCMSKRTGLRIKLVQKMLNSGRLSRYFFCCIFNMFIGS